MAPKANNGGKNGNIAEFFKRFTIPKSRRPANDEPEEDIVVASLQQESRIAKTSKQSGRNSQNGTATTPQKTKPAGGPRQSPSFSPPSEMNTLKRKRTSPQTTQSKSRCEATSSPCRSPQNASQLRNLNPRSGVANLTPTRDSPYREATATPPRRVLLGSISSSSKKYSTSPERMAAPPIPSPLFARSVNEVPAAASFTSTSSLSTVPPSSQPSSIPISSTTSSRRVFRDGRQTVMNSDSDDSDEELAEVSSLLKRPKLTPPAEPPRSAPGSSAVGKRLPDRMVNPHLSRRLPISPPRTEFKNSRLAKLIAKNEGRRLAQERIRAMEMEVEESKKRNALTENQADHAFKREALLNLAADDNQREELLVALERTEALKAVNHYYFFLDDQPRWTDSPFPVDSLPDELWCNIYRDARSRAEACISGLAAELVEQFPLPMNVTMWFASQLMHETSEILCEAYVEILRVSSKHHHDTSMSDTIASLNSRYHTRSFFENDKKGPGKKTLPMGLQYVLRTLQFCAPASDSVVLDATPTTTCAAFLDLALLNIDVLVREDVNLSNLVANCIQEMLDELPEASFRTLVTEVLEILFEPTELPPLVRCRAISNLPCNTPRTYDIRRRLALECFSTVSDRRLADSQDWQASILHTLQTQDELHISDDMDYDYLMAMVAVVDIAVANGFTEYSSLMPPSPPVRAAGSLAFSRPLPLTEIERTHNRQIDLLVEQLQSMMSRVKDSGTSHLGRTQAKSLTEGLVVRLESCVRTRLRPKKGVFSRGMQSKFEVPASKPRIADLREKPSEVKKEKERVEVVPVEILGDRDESLY